MNWFFNMPRWFYWFLLIAGIMGLIGLITYRDVTRPVQNILDRASVYKKSPRRRSPGHALEEQKLTYNRRNSYLIVRGGNINIIPNLNYFASQKRNGDN